MYTSIVPEDLAQDLRDFGYQGETSFYYDYSKCDSFSDKPELKTSGIHTDDESFHLNTFIPIDYNSGNYSDRVSAPTYAEVFDYFVHYNIVIGIIPVSNISIPKLISMGLYRYSLLIKGNIFISKTPYRVFNDVCKEAVYSAMRFYHKLENDEGFIDELFKVDYKDLIEL